MASSAPVEMPPLGKHLASSEQRTRDKAIKDLAVFLSDNEVSAMQNAQMAELWKGVFYCFWMSDKPLYQQALAGDIAELLLTITHVPLSLHFLRGFWTTIVREWSGLDRLRKDKFYMLIRRFVNASFRLLIREKWDESVIEEYNTVLDCPGGPLCAEDPRVPSGVIFHLMEIYLEELEKALAAMESSSPVPLITLLSPFLSFAARGPTSTYKHLEGVVLEPLLMALTPRRACPPKRARLSKTSFTNIITKANRQDSGEAGAIEVLRKAVLQAVFSIASAKYTKDSIRHRMYAFYKAAWEDGDDRSGE